MHPARNVCLDLSLYELNSKFSYNRLSVEKYSILLYIFYRKFLNILYVHERKLTI